MEGFCSGIEYPGSVLWQMKVTNLLEKIADGLAKYMVSILFFNTNIASYNANSVQCSPDMTVL
jgi:hypothetical protein